MMAWISVPSPVGIAVDVDVEGRREKFARNGSADAAGAAPPRRPGPRCARRRRAVGELRDRDVACRR